MKPFNTTRAVFWLVAAVVGVHLAIALGCVGFCVYYGREIVEDKYRCDPQGKCIDVLRSPFTFIGGFFKPAPS